MSEINPCPFSSSIVGHTLELYPFNQDGQGCFEETHGIRCLTCPETKISINEWNAFTARLAEVQRSSDRYKAALQKIADGDYHTCGLYDSCGCADRFADAAISGENK